jgi:hypothetical protein
MNMDVSMRQRALTVLRGEKPTRLPFITRLEAWYKSHTRTNTLPEHLRGLSLVLDGSSLHHHSHFDYVVWRSNRLSMASHYIKATNRS